MLGTFLLLVGMAPPTPQQLSSELAWDAPDTCPDASEVVRRAEELAGLENGEAGLEVEAQVRPIEEGFQLRLTIRSPDEGQEHTRELEAVECGALADLTALVLALGIDPFGIAEPARAPEGPVGPRPDPTAPADPTAPTEPTEPTELEAQPEPTLVRDADVPPPVLPPPATPPRSPHAGQEGVGFGLRLLAGGEYGALPNGSGGARLALGLLTRRFRVEAHGSYWLPRPALLASKGVGLDLRLAAGGVDGCYRFYAGRRVELPVCVGAEFGLMRADTVGTPAAERAHALWSAARLAPAVSWRVADWVGLWAGLEGFVALARPRFSLTTDEVFTPAPVGGRLLAGVEFGF